LHLTDPWAVLHAQHLTPVIVSSESENEWGPPAMKLYRPSYATPAFFGLLVALLSSLAIAQADPILSPDAIKPDAVISSEQTNPPPVRSLEYIKPDRALSPEQTETPRVRSLDYTKPDEALSPEQTDPSPVLAPNWRANGIRPEFHSDFSQC
jgi:hypothetical protein